jgi:hypothetical protein
MTIDKRLWLALVTLAELVDQVEDGPARPTAAARLALAICHEHSDGDREPFIDFWRQMLDPCENSGTPTIARYCRPTQLQIQLRRVLRAVGIEPNHKIEIALDQAARKSNARAA